MVNCEALLFQTISESISGIIPNLIWMFLFIWGIRKVAENMPKWISQIKTEQKEKSAISQALGRFGR